MLMFVMVVSAYAGVELKIVRSSSNMLDVQLINSESVSGVQFSLRASDGIKLGMIKPGTLATKASCIFDSYVINDSTVNVLILNARNTNSSNGDVTLVSINFTLMRPMDTIKAGMTNVMVINANGDSLGVLISGGVWNNTSCSAINADKFQQCVLGQNYPNPFNPSTMLNYRVNTAGYVRLYIYDMAGREVIRLVDQYQYVGEYTVRWDSRLLSGQTLASGIYIARLTVHQTSVSRKMLLTK